MDRRTTLATLLGQKTETAAPPVVSSGLTPYTGSFEFQQASHLLRRTTFGPNYEMIKKAVNAGLDATLAELLADNPLPEPPLNYDFEEDPLVPVGETWVNATYPTGSLKSMVRNYRSRSLRAWTFKQMIEEGTSIRETMTLFWHNHYVTGDINDPNFEYRYITLLRENALGNFRELTKKVTIDPAMLRYLNGNQNIAAAPNENYARELLELFTIGKGPLVGPGDYTNYTEQDVIQMARVLTGWRDRGYNSSNPDQPVDVEFRYNQHDQLPKLLSPRFDNAIINDMADQEYAYLVDLIFTKNECARFISRKLYRWFVYYVIDDNVEQNVIEPLAQIIIDNDYEIKPALDALLRSEHFFDMLSMGPMIKHPIDFMISALRNTNFSLSQFNLDQEYTILWNIFRLNSEGMQMVYFTPPSVAGWKAWYQEPSFYRTWINSATLNVRQNYTARIANSGYTGAGGVAKLDVLSFVASLDDPFDPNSLISEIASILFPQPISQEQKDALKGVLIPGLPDFEWTVEYSDYVNNPGDPNLEAAVEDKLRNLLTAMLSMPEFYLS
ncbi:MAG: hypothetical protein Kow0027_21900 [Saprospiraceae bacterium]